MKIKAEYEWSGRKDLDIWVFAFSDENSEIFNWIGGWRCRVGLRYSDIIGVNLVDFTRYLVATFLQMLKKHPSKNPRWG